MHEHVAVGNVRELAFESVSIGYRDEAHARSG
jgi:hypothetical protein